MNDIRELFGSPGDPRYPDAGGVPHLRDLFSDEEILAAYRAVLPEDEAREMAAGSIRGLDARLPIEFSGATLRLLAAVSPDCARRVGEYQSAVAAAAARSQAPRRWRWPWDRSP